jgi:predicted ATPase
LDLEDIQFRCEDLSAIKEATDSKGKVKRTRILALKRAGGEYSFVDEYSDGTLIVIAMLTSLLSERGRPLFCLEELENCLHPAAIEKLLRFLQDHADKWPVLITTHSPYLLNGVRPEDVNVAVVDKTGATHFEKVENTKQLRDYLNKGLMNFGDLLVRDFEGYREK